MKIQLLRHATLVVTIGDIRLLVDPMLSPAGAMEPVANAANQQRIPLVDLPISDSELHTLIEHTDAVLVTHTHRDHWDAAAVELLPKTLPILCQPTSEEAIRKGGFSIVIPVVDHLNWRGIQFQRTGGQHGTGEIGHMMGIVSGFVLKSPSGPVLYIAGDTIWCLEVETALRAYQPNVVVVNAGAAQFLTGDPITMTAGDVSQVCSALPTAKVIAVHMETVNHCGLTRRTLHDYLAHERLDAQVEIPLDGVTLTI